MENSATKYQFNNWHKFQSVSKKYGSTDIWFKLNGDFFTRLPYMSMNALQKLCALYLFCEATRAGNEGAFFINRETSRVFLREAHRELDRAVEILVEFKILKQPRESGRFTRKKEVRKERIPRKKNASAAPLDCDFNALYNLYPRQEGKKKGLEFLKRQIKTQEQYDQLKIAVQNYSSKVSAEGTEKRFIKLFSSFTRVWEDYINLPGNRSLEELKSLPANEKVFLTPSEKDKLHQDFFKSLDANKAQDGK